MPSATLRILLSLLLVVSIMARSQVADWPQTLQSPLPSYPSPAAPGPLRKKAADYDTWNAKHHHPFYGGLVAVRFTDLSYSTVSHYDCTGDSAIWTGTHLASQALRYKVTGEAAALENIRVSVRALHGYLDVTNTSGYIARYWGKQDPKVFSDGWCQANAKCHKVTQGKYAGDFWIGDTSKDQYSGWFLGMSLAYDCLNEKVKEENDLRDMIRSDVTTAVDRLIKDGWIIKNEKGEYELISAKHRPIYVYQVSWLTVAYHMTGYERFKTILEGKLNWFWYIVEIITAYTGYFNKYKEYYGFNLSQTTWYNLLRLGRAYFGSTAYENLKWIYTNYDHELVKLTHNPWFSAIFMSQGNYKEATKDDKYKQHYREDMGEFRACPNFAYYLPAKKIPVSELDPVTSWLSYFPWLNSILVYIKLEFRLQAKKPFPISQRCSDTFLFQMSPYTIDACGYNDKLRVDSGHDYLAAYWVGVYHGIISLSE